MKIISSILGLAFVLISTCIFYLVKSGVSIRTAPIIKPSEITSNFTNVPEGLYSRIFPDIQQAQFIIWGIPNLSPEALLTIETMKKLYFRDLKSQVTIIPDGLNNSEAKIKECPRPCWIIVPANNANELKENKWLQSNVHPLHEKYITISWLEFNRNIQAPKPCLEEKRLDLHCLHALSIQDVSRKFKDPEKRYFFARKYLDTDYFLFIETK